MQKAKNWGKKLTFKKKYQTTRFMLIEGKKCKGCKSKDNKVVVFVIKIILE